VMKLLIFSAMQKRGMIPRAAPETNSEGVVDFSASSMVVSEDAGSSSLGNAAGDFLSNLAGVGSSGVGTSVTDNLRAARLQARQSNNTQINEFKIKTEDNEYKIRQLEERIRRLESKLGDSGF